MATITQIDSKTVEDQERIQAAVTKLAQYDPDIVLHLEQLADLAQTNKLLFQMGISFLKKR